MISEENYSEHHIRELQAMGKADPALIERTLYAFGLLEALSKVGLDFIFKGGTSLLLLLPHPKRLSTDIDIIVKPDTDVDAYIEKAGHIFPFIAKEEQIRAAGSKIVKRHFKFTYDSPVHKAPLYILLDIVFENNPYERIIEREIKNELLITKGKNLTVRLPSVDCLLADKLTAFAPHSTGVELGKKKNIEIIKQFYDVSMLIDEFDNFDDVRKTYFSLSEIQLRYRGMNSTPGQALEDTLQAAVCIGSRGRMAQSDYSSYLQGTRDISNHILDGGFSMEAASSLAPKVIYLVSCLLTGTDFDRNADLEVLRTENVIQEELKNMNFLRKLKNSSYSYLVLADRLLCQYRNPEQD